MPYSKARKPSNWKHEQVRGDPLTQTQERYLEMLCAGRDLTQIGAAVGKDTSCVSRQLQCARVKLGAATYPELAVKFDRLRRK